LRCKDVSAHDVVAIGPPPLAVDSLLCEIESKACASDQNPFLPHFTGGPQ
jgi:hypothetical protein